MENQNLSQNNAPARAKCGFSLSHLAFLLGAILVLLRLFRAAKHTDFRAKIVLITGGSRGLGLCLAREFAAQGARLALVARDEAELSRAASELRAAGADVFTFAADITEKDAPQRIVSEVVKRFGALDILVNNAGIMTFGPHENMDEADYEAAMNLHFWAPLRLIEAAKPFLKQSKSARIVNIVSIGGLVAVPLMAPYTASKFALAGLSDALRSELAKDGISVTTVCPGIMRTGSHLAVKFKGPQKLLYKLFKIGASFGAVSDVSAAKQILDATRYGDPSLTFPAPMFWASVFSRLFPNTAGFKLALVGRVLPKPTDDGDKAISGHDLEPEVADSPIGKITKLADNAAVKNNELNGHALKEAAEK